MCQGVRHKKHTDMPEPDIKPELPHPWSLLGDMNAALQNRLHPTLPAGSFVPGLAEAFPSLQSATVGCDPFSARAIGPWY